MRPWNDSTGASDSRSRCEGESTGIIVVVNSAGGALPVKICRVPILESLAALFGKDNPGKLSVSLLSVLAVGVAAGSTDTTELMGKTRSVAKGLRGPEGESTRSEMGELKSCIFGFHVVERSSLEPHEVRFRDSDLDFGR